MDLHQRKKIRLKGYDYSEIGYYFVTICIENRKCILGSILSKNVGAGSSRPQSFMKLNDIGEIVNKWLLKIEDKFDVELDIYQIMPNHIHFIVCILKSNNDINLGNIIAYFKYQSTKQINNVGVGYSDPIEKGRENPAPTKKLFNKIWQRNYYEHIIRNEKELYEIKEYITLNPIMWEKDQDNPKNIR